MSVPQTQQLCVQHNSSVVKTAQIMNISYFQLFMIQCQQLD